MRTEGKTGFASDAEKVKMLAVESPEQALEDARRAGIDLDLLDTNLALSYEDRVLRNASALELVRALREAGAAYEKSPLIAPEVEVRIEVERLEGGAI